MGQSTCWFDSTARQALSFPGSSRLLATSNKLESGHGSYSAHTHTHIHGTNRCSCVIPRPIDGPFAMDFARLAAQTHKTTEVRAAAAIPWGAAILSAAVMAWGAAIPWAAAMP